jgi:C4-dicarboxylate-binding protein DctP
MIEMLSTCSIAGGGHSMIVRTFLLLLVSLLLSLGEAGAQQVKLRLTMQIAANEPFMGVSYARLKEEVERRIGDELIIELFDRSQLYKDTEVVGAVASGAIEMGHAGFNFFADEVPAISILEQPFLFNFEALVRAATSPESEVRRVIDEAILASTGVRVLWWHTVGSTILFSKGRDIADPEQLKGRRVRVFSKTLEEFARRCGGTPVSMPVSKVYDAFQEGTIDVGMIGLSALQSRELWKVTDTVTRTDHALYEYFLIVNEKVWQSLSPKHREVIADVARSVERQARERVAEIEAKAYAFAQSKGMAVRELTPDQVAEWRACGSDVLVDYMTRNAEVADRLMAAYAKLRMDPCCTAGPSAAPMLRR